MELNKYEAVVIFQSELSDDAVKAEVAKIDGIVQSHQGQMTSVDYWGRRQLAYKIKKKEFGIYVLMVFEGNNSLVAELERLLRINELVLRHLVVVKDKFAPDPSPRLKEDAQASRLDQDIEPEFAPDYDEDEVGSPV